MLLGVNPVIRTNLKDDSSLVCKPTEYDEVIPAVYPTPFTNGIDHPNLFLWDVWSAKCGNTVHLYCLAVSNKDKDGNPISPDIRNDLSFHIRHFETHDNGQTWNDCGIFQRARAGRGLFDSRSIWSGSILPLDDGRKLMGYTGIKQGGDTLTFHQSIALSISDNWNSLTPGSETLLSDPLIDYDTIIEHGYFLGKPSELGHKDGEEGGPILAWRDPYLLEHEGQIHMFWSAKSDSQSPALGHALLSETPSGFKISKLFNAATMPDGSEYTQLELPKIIYDHVQQRFIMLVSSCNRLHEGQTDKEADKRMRLYSAQSLTGPWSECGHSGSTLSLAEPNMFGVTFIDADFESQTLHYVAPYTEDAGVEKFLTLSKTYSLDISGLGT